jgi:hypothetical protein
MIATPDDGNIWQQRHVARQHRRRRDNAGADQTATCDRGYVNLDAIDKSRERSMCGEVTW